MRSASSPAPSPAQRIRDRQKRKGATRRRESRHRLSLALESLECRQLLATLPVAVPDPQLPLSTNGLDSTRDISKSGNNVNDSQPSIVIDPTNPLKMVSVWTSHDATAPRTTYMVRGAFSSNGGLTWTTFAATPFVLIDPATGTNPQAFIAVQDASVAFDRNDNFYVLENQLASQTSFASGALVVTKFNFSGQTPTQTSANVLKLWNQGDTTNFPDPTAYFRPVLAVDNNLPSFTDPSGGGTLTDPGAGNIYIAYDTDVPPPNGVTIWTRTTVELTPISTDGGNTISFGTPLTVGAGHFQNVETDTAPQITISQGRLAGTNGQGDAGVAGGLVTVVIDDIQEGRNAGPPQDLIWTKAFRPVAGGGLTPGSRVLATTTTVLGTLNANASAYPRTGPAMPDKGFGPGATLASDNTLGRFSPHEGRIYLAYVDRFDPALVPAASVAPNPNDNTDIFLLFSDNGGLSWAGGDVVNDDSSPNDGFSESIISTAYITGRPQFQPSVAVDPQTGTVAVSYMDARYDAARARTVISLQTSIDGGQTFSPSTFVNSPATGFNEISRTTDSVGPIPDNFSAGNPGRDTTTGPGDHQGLAIFGGHVYAVWSSNVNGGADTNGGAGGSTLRTDIRVAPYLVSAGPRVIGSTMGQVKAVTVNDLATGDPITFNNTFTVDGTPQADGFVVTFDRPIDASSFTTADIQVFFHDPLSPGTAIQVPVTSVAAIDDGTNTQARFGPTTFLVRFAPQSTTGEYTYNVGPNIRDLIRSPIATNTYYALQAPANLPRIPPVGTGGTGDPLKDRGSSTITISGVPATQQILDLNVELTLSHPNDNDLVIRLYPPGGGAPIILAQNVPAGQSASGFTDTTFDDQARAAITGGPNANDPNNNHPDYFGHYRPVGVLRNLNGTSPNGTWRLEIEDTKGGNTGQLVSWGLVVTTKTTNNTAAQTGNLMDQDGNALGAQDPSGSTIVGLAPGDVYSVPTPNPTSPEVFFGPVFNPPYSPTTLPLIVPGPHMVRTFVAGAPATAVGGNLVTDKPVTSIDVVFDRNMDLTSFDADGRDIVSMIGPNGPISGPFTVTPDPIGDPANPDPDPAHPRTFRISFPKQQVNGTYSVTFGPNILSQAGESMDQNQNAGLDVSRNTPSLGTQQLTYGSQAAAPIGGGAAGTTYVSSIFVSDSFLIAAVPDAVTVKLNITYPNDPDLTAVLVAPDGFQVQLFSGVGANGTHANFTNTIFDDTATTPITNGGPPFFGRFNPQPGLGGTLGNLANHASAGIWQLRVTVGAAGTAGTINNWSLTLRQPLSSTGLGEPTADRATASFRIFTQDPTNPLASDTWTAVGPTGVGAKGPGLNAEVAGRATAIAVDPSDPSGNTVYIGAPSGGVWKTTNFLTHDPAGPTWLPLFDHLAAYAINVSTITVFPRNNDPAQSVIFVGTGDSDSPGDVTRTPAEQINDQGAQNFHASDTSRGVGMIRSMDGGATWQLLDSTDNTLPFASRDHRFAFTGSGPGDILGGAVVNKIVVDPKPTPDGGIIVYAAISDTFADGSDGGPPGIGVQDSAGNPYFAAGFWRSLDGGLTWGVVGPNGARIPNRSGEATDIVLDYNSPSASTGNLQFLYAAFRGEGVFFSPNRGQVFNLMTGQVGDPLIQNADFPQPQPVGVLNKPSPNSAFNGRIVLAKPALTGNALQDLIYQGWLYALVVNHVGDLVNGGANDFVGLYLTKDFGQTWTLVAIPANGSPDLPSNDTRNNNYTITGFGTPAGSPLHFGNFDLSIAVDPLNANVVYLGGTNEFQGSGLVRVDTTGIHDAHSFYLDNTGVDLANPANGALRTRGGGNTGNQTDPTRGIPPFIPPYDAAATPFLNLIRDPANPFQGDSTILVTNWVNFINDGAHTKWTAFDQAITPDPYANPLVDSWGLATRGVHQIVTFVDPQTGRTRLIVADDQGVYSSVDNGDGTLVGSLGDTGQTLDTNTGVTPVVSGSRNGNLQIAQFYQGAAQPSFLASQLAALQGFFYGSGEDIGLPMSDPGVIQPGQPGYGNLSWTGGLPNTPTTDRWSPRGGLAVQQDVQTDLATGQPLGGNVYQYAASESLVGTPQGRPSTDTFQVNTVGRTFGMYQTSNQGDTPDAQWSFRQGYSFAINPLRGDDANGQAIISSRAGRIFSTETSGRIWAEIGNPDALDNSQALALAYGAPDPNGPGGVGNLNNYLFAGTLGGFDADDTVHPVGGHIYVTFTGGGGGNGGVAGNQWLLLSKGLDGSAVQQIITNPTRGSHEAYAVTLNGVYHMVDSTVPGAAWQKITGNLPLDYGAVSSVNGPAGLRYLSAIQADWRYLIPDNLSQPGGPTHPMLYVAGEGGVFRSLDGGTTWTPFPESAPGGLLDPSQFPSTPQFDNTLALTNGAGLPNAHVTDLDLTLGNINTTTGRPDVSTGSNSLVATTYGRGSFTIRLAPVIFGPTVQLDPNVPPPSGSDSGASGTDFVTNVTAPVIDGLSEQTAFGNVVRITVFDLTTGTPRIIGGWDGVAGDATDVAANYTDANGRFAVKVNANAFLNPDGVTYNDGPKILAVQATDQSGTKGNLARLPGFILDTTLPKAPSLPDLEDASDNGLSIIDNITSIKVGLAFGVADTASPSEPATTVVQLFRDNVMVGTAQALDAQHRSVLIDPGPVADGVHSYKARMVDLAGNVGPFGPTLSVTVDTSPPARPFAPILDPTAPLGGSDTGIVGDNITAVRSPFLAGTGEPGGLAQIIDSAGNVIGFGAVAANGSYSIQPGTAGPGGTYVPTQLADGTYVFRVQIEDVAGNVSQASPSITVTILATAPGTPTLQLVPADDSGVVGDNITNVTKPRLQGTGTPGLSIQLVDLGNGQNGFAAVPGTVPINGLNVVTPIPPATPIVVANDRTFLIQFPGALPTGKYQVAVAIRDVAGNFRLSAPLVLTIVNGTGGTIGAPTLALLPADDTGPKGDNTTSLRRPRFTGTARDGSGNPVPGATIDLVDATTNIVQATVTASTTGVYTVQLPSDLLNGRIKLVTRQRDIAGNQGPSSDVLNLSIVSAFDDYDSDGRSDPATYHGQTSPIVGGVFTVQPSLTPTSTSITTIAGVPARAIPLSGDFDGDGKTDPAAYDPDTGTWYIQRSRLGLDIEQLGQAGDIPVAGDYDGDGRTDIGIYRPSTALWLVRSLSAGTIVNRAFGQPNVDQPIPEDFDGDGKTDLVVYRPTDAHWMSLLSTSTPTHNVVLNTAFGQPGLDLPIAADFDGDGKADLATYRPTTANWLSLVGYAQNQIFGTTYGGKVYSAVVNRAFGQPDVDIPTPVDFDGDGKTDLATYRPTDSRWLSLPGYALGNFTSVVNVIVGNPGDIPVPAPLSFRYRLSGRSYFGQPAFGGGNVRSFSVGGSAGDQSVPAVGLPSAGVASNGLASGVTGGSSAAQQRGLSSSAQAPTTPPAQAGDHVLTAALDSLGSLKKHRHRRHH